MTASIASIPSPATVPLLDARTLLARVDARITVLRRALGHDHRDEPYWLAFGCAASWAQCQRATLRQVANLLHVERATRRGRLHGTRFATLDDQRAWLATMTDFRCNRAARFCGLPADATLARLRAGELVVPAAPAPDALP